MIKEFTCTETGIKTIYTYQESIVRGIQSVEIVYPSSYRNSAELQDEKNKKLPKSKQRFLNPETGKEVSYMRAKALGIL